MDNRSKITALQYGIFWLRQVVSTQHQALYGHDGHGSTSGYLTGLAEAMATALLTRSSSGMDASGNGDRGTEVDAAAETGASNSVGVPANVQRGHG